MKSADIYCKEKKQVTTDITKRNCNLNNVLHLIIADEIKVKGL